MKLMQSMMQDMIVIGSSESSARLPTFQYLLEHSGMTRRTVSLHLPSNRGCMSARDRSPSLASRRLRERPGWIGLEGSLDARG